MTSQYTVYAKCSVGLRPYLQSMFRGSRRQCQNFIRGRVRAGLPTHFLFISSCSIERATQLYL